MSILSIYLCFWNVASNENQRVVYLVIEKKQKRNGKKTELETTNMVFIEPIYYCNGVLMNSEERSNEVVL